jgi:hypothetical protein
MVTRRALVWIAASGVFFSLCLSPSAAAHGGGGALGFRSKVVRITPAAKGLSVAVVDSDDRLKLRNETGRPLVILGYEDEPYLAFRDSRVHHNIHSPATYLNDDRFGNVTLPARADPKAAPQWEQVASREEFEWHDHRIHWMNRTLPPKVMSAKNERHHVFDWTVPAKLGGTPLVISGSLDYEPPPSGSPRILIGALVLLASGGSAAIWLRRRRERREPSTSRL